MNNSVMIIQMNTGWLLKLTTFTGNSQPLVTQYTFNKLAEALQAACILKVHVDNNNVLPLKQYKQGA